MLRSSLCLHAFLCVTPSGGSAKTPLQLISYLVQGREQESNALQAATIVLNLSAVINCEELSGCKIAHAWVSQNEAQHWGHNADPD